MVSTRELARGYISELKKTLDSISLDRFEQMYNAILQAYDNGNSIFIMGNGGSGATASHFACDINKGVCFGLSKKAKATCLNDNIPILLAYANDTCYDDVFVEQLKNFLSVGDIVIGISASGNSANVVKALRYANQKGAISVALTGFDGGKLAKIAIIPMVIAINDMQKVEDIHMILVHMLMQILSKRLRERQRLTPVYQVAAKIPKPHRQPPLQELPSKG